MLALEEKRVARRFDGRVGVVSADELGLDFGIITNLSRHGAFVETQKYIPVGEHFEFVLSNGSIKSHFLGRVVRNHIPSDSTSPAGVAIHFVSLSALAKRVRDDVLMHWMLGKFSPKWH